MATSANVFDGFRKEQEFIVSGNGENVEEGIQFSENNQMKLQIDSFTAVKAEITIDEHDLFECDTQELEADNHDTGNVETQSTLMQSNTGSKSCRNVLQLNDHLLTHPRERPHACSICNRIFERKSDLVQHRKKHAKQNQNICNICQQEFICCKRLRLHLITHSNDRPHACDFCNLRYKRKSDLVQHRNKHTKQRQYICKICQQGFIYSTSLRYHLIAHSNDRPHASEACNSTFQRAGELKAHRNEHTKEKHYECEVCHNRFSSFQALRSHKTVHSDQRLFKCGICKHTFKAKQSLQVHRNTHTKEKHYELQIDSFTTVKEEITITEHNLFEYDTLGLEADNHSTGNVETQNTLMQSNPCSKLNRDLLHLNEHLSTHPGERPHACEVCHKIFLSLQALRSHKTVHSEQRPFECDICKQTFKAKLYLKVHRNTHTKEKHYECELMIFERISRFIQTTALLNAIFANSVLKENQLGGSIQMHTRRTTSLIIPKGVLKGLSLKRRIKEEITIDDHDPLEVQNVDIKADERQTLNTKDQKTSKNALCCKI
ncbi:hypothetical protein D910_07692 [Dendroctonus ponderosae]|uniref:C2H2-type domain-containing protein n=1 Tax=Dendroctonus ponderosae TaxID=77166 RepID=U4UDH7_DENPD|nr:hypothetical protein D910_07692 [Dendroctonus ponderosae]